MMQFLKMILGKPDAIRAVAMALEHVAQAVEKLSPEWTIAHKVAADVEAVAKQVEGEPPAA